MSEHKQGCSALLLLFAAELPKSLYLPMKSRKSETNIRHRFGLPGDPGVHGETLNSQGGLNGHNYLADVTVHSS